MSSSPAERRRLLVIEPDELTRWSITTYLQRWFTVETVESCELAAQAVAQGSFAALILPDELPSRAAAALQRLARKHNPTLTIVRTVSGASDGAPPGTSTVQIEKPFDLAHLARLLGVPQQEIAPR